MRAFGIPNVRKGPHSLSGIPRVSEPRRRWACRNLWRRPQDRPDQAPSDFVNCLKSEADCEQPVLLADGPRASKAEALAYPSVDGRVVILQAALQQHLLNVTVAECVAQLPGDGLDDQRRLELPPLEVTLGLTLQLGGDGAEDHEPAPERRRQARSVCLTTRERHRVRVCDTPLNPGGSRRQSLQASYPEKRKREWSG